MDKDKHPQDATRKSARKKSKSSPEDASTEPDASGSATAPRKKRASTTNKRKGKTGKLEGIVVMPLDVLFEILSYLYPLDILHLARTTKQFRGALMNKAHAFVWKAARENVPGYPECFPDINEAQMARLTFDPHCYVCLKPNCRTIDWVLRVRLCHKCAPTSLTSFSTFSRTFDEFFEPGMLGFERAIVKLACLRADSRNIMRSLAFKEEVESVTAHWCALQTPEERKAYLLQRRDFIAAVNAHAIECIRWSESQRTDRSQELQEARDSRKAAIIEKLVDLGWGFEIKKIPGFPLESTLAQHKLVKQPTRLTARIWANIEPEMIKYMEQMKRNRLERERLAIIVSRKRPAIEAIRAYKISQLPWTDVMPEPPDYCQMAPVKAILELPNEINVDVSSFASVVPALPALFAEWRRDAQTQVLRLLPEYALEQPPISIGPPSLNAAHQFQLATTAFDCTRCKPCYTAFNPTFSMAPLLYPEFLSHCCLTSLVFAGNVDHADTSVYLENQRTSARQARAEWTCEKLTINTCAREMMEAIVIFCRLDPASAPTKDLDELDVWLGCQNCARWLEGPDEAQVSVFGWRNAIKHQAEEHKLKSVTWLELSEGQKQQALSGAPGSSVKVMDHGNLPPSNTTTIERWSCVHCLDRTWETVPQVLSNVVNHLLELHEIIDPQVDIDYYRSRIGQKYAYRTSWATFNITTEIPSVPSGSTLESQYPSEAIQRLRLYKQSIRAKYDSEYF